jgi:hypothetical protein
MRFVGIGLGLIPGGASSDPAVYYAWNPADKGAGVTLSNGDHTASTSSTANSVRGITGHGPTGHWYFEIRPSNEDSVIGLGAAGADLLRFPGGNADGLSWGYLGANGNKFNANSGVGWGASYGTGDVIGVEYDGGDLKYWKNGLPQGTAFSGLSGTLYPMWGATSAPGDHSAIINTGDSAFAYPLPAGATAWG